MALQIAFYIAEGGTAALEPPEAFLAANRRHHHHGLARSGRQRVEPFRQSRRTRSSPVRLLSVD